MDGRSFSVHVFVLALAVLNPRASEALIQQVAEPTQTSRLVNVHLYMESLCPDTSHFIRYQLHKHWSDLRKMVNLTIIPFGKARATPMKDNTLEFDCQHGPDECHGNIVQSCVVSKFDIDVQVEFINCMFKHSDSAFSGKPCAESLNLPWEEIRQCVEGTEGPKLLYANGVLTSKLRPSLFFVPTVTFDGVYGRRSLRSSLNNFKREVCDRYGDPPGPGC